ncbi:MAG: hypothetical protein EBS68_15135, partial [Rhodobacteraceae bacterium]|nr:hypothetical protein [Paracoccaceae bacterium]
TMPRRVLGERLLYETARDRDLQGVFSALLLIASEALKHEGEPPPWLETVLRQWTLLERGHLQHGSPEQPDDQGQGKADIEELAAVLSLIPGVSDE